MLNEADDESKSNTRAISVRGALFLLLAGGVRGCGFVGMSMRVMGCRLYGNGNQWEVGSWVLGVCVCCEETAIEKV